MRLGVSVVDAKARIARLGAPSEGTSRSPQATPTALSPTADELPAPPAPRDARPAPQATDDGAQRISRRALLGFAAGGVASLALGGFLATRPTRRDEALAATEPRALPPQPTPTPSPASLVVPAGGLFARLDYAPGEPIDSAHGILFMTIRGDAVGRVEGWRLRDDAFGGDLPRYGVSPGGRFVTAPGALLDRSTGQQYAWPAEQLWLRTPSERGMLFASLGPGRNGDLEPTGTHHVTDAELRTRAAFDLPPDQGRGPAARFSPDSNLLYLAITPRQSRAGVYQVDIASSRARRMLAPTGTSDGQPAQIAEFTQPQGSDDLMVRAFILPRARIFTGAGVRPSWNSGASRRRVTRVPSRRSR